jgi:hypothetical protein
MTTSARNSRTVKEALRDNRWILGIAGDISANLALELVRLWTAMREVVLNSEQEDCFTWPCSPTGLYSVKATYDDQHSRSRLHLGRDDQVCTC